MSARHDDDAVRPRATIEAHKRSDRHRVHIELGADSGLYVDPDTALDLTEPADRYKTERHHTPDKRRRRTRRDRFAHWKRKQWKRRTNQRLARARLEAQLR